MKKVKIHYSTKAKDYYAKAKYHTQTMLLNELPKSDFFKYDRPINIDAVLKLAIEWVNEKNPNTFNKVINIQIVY